MSEEQSTGLVRAADSPKPSRRAHLSVDDAVPHREVEIVTEEEKRHDEQARRKADSPQEFFKSSPVIEPPVTLGAAVSCESLLGFLVAMEAILPPDANYPILSSAKVVYDPEEPPRLYLEAGSHAVWTVIALKAAPASKKGFTVVLPVRRAKNILMALRDTHPTVVVGVDDQGIGIGPHTVPFGGPIDDFPAQPIVVDWVARAAMPAFYFREICDRVMVARSDDFKETALHGVLLDFESHTIDEVIKPLCTAVATDGHRIHILRLPQMLVDVKQTRLRALPPTCTIAAGFFQYIKEIVQHEWAGLEFSPDQVVAKGDDYVVIAKASVEGRSSLRELASWRKVNVDHPGYWLASKAKLLQVIKSAELGGTASEFHIQVDGIKEMLTISSTNPSGDKFAESIAVRGFDGPAIVNLHISIKYMREAIESCMGGLVRLAFAHDRDVQATSPVVIRGEDEQFKAIIMPRT